MKIDFGSYFFYHPQYYYFGNQWIGEKAQKAGSTAKTGCSSSPEIPYRGA